MINVLLPAMGTSSFFKDSYFPKPLYEIRGKTMLEIVFPDEDCKRFHLDASARMLTSSCKVLQLRNQTAGALCTCLMAVKYVNNEVPLLIVNSDQIIDVDYRKVLKHFEQLEETIV